MKTKRCYIARRPMVWWYVEGRRQFDWRISPRIRSMWKVGRYLGG